MLGSATVTAKTGPGTQVTDKVIENIRSMVLNLGSSVVTFSTGDVGSPGLEFDLADVDTITITISGKTYTMVVSN